MENNKEILDDRLVLLYALQSKLADFLDKYLDDIALFRLQSTIDYMIYNIHMDQQYGRDRKVILSEEESKKVVYNSQLIKFEDNNIPVINHTQIYENGINQFLQYVIQKNGGAKLEKDDFRTFLLINEQLDEIMKQFNKSYIDNQ